MNAARDPTGRFSTSASTQHPAQDSIVTNHVDEHTLAEQRIQEDIVAPRISDLVEIVVLVVQIIARTIVGVVWALVGLLLWIPLLVRIIAVFSTAVMVSTFHNESRYDMNRAERALDTAIRFYPEGFLRIVYIHKAEGDAGPIDPITFKFIRLYVIPNVIVSLIFWFICLVIMGAIDIQWEKMSAWFISAWSRLIG